jgi:outer membrane protein OmpA-like peptidoglycan-associated protein/tetratricopeptide (TPR) repeat protein
MKIITFIITFTLLLTTYHSHAQTAIPQKALAAYYAAKDYGSRTQWEEGIVELEKAIKIYPQFTPARELLGEFYYALRQYEKAVAALESAASEKDFSPRSMFLLSEIYLKMGNGEKAKLYAEKFLAMPTKSPGAAKKAEQTVLNANFAVEAKKHPVPFNPKNLGTAINTGALEYFPYMTPDGKLLAFTRMDHNQEDLYIARKIDSGFAQAVSFGDVINTYENEGAEAMNADGSILFFTGCNKMDGFGSCDIYFSQKINNAWSQPTGIGKPVNSGAWEAQPSFSSDGKALYFASNRKGGYGGKDIWVSFLDENMKWSEPANLGPNVNTMFDDQCPFIHADNQTLYFTSNGWPGIGDGDIFVSRKIDTGWTKAENLGYPINTENNDNGMTVSYEGTTAFLSSSREGGLGGLDIYSFELPEKMQPQKITYIKGIVRDAKTRQLLQANYSVVDLETQKEVYKGISSSGNFFVSIQANKNYALQVQKEKYLFYSQNINLTEASKLKPYELEILLEPIATNNKIVLNNVFFDFDKSELNSESFVELNKVVELLQKNPTIKIEISGHTDNKGDDKYNLTLSQRRAESVVDYLAQKGIDKTRLTAKGYGETQPVAPNDTEENKAKNRRTEMKVL